jgi:hypothetical protein
MVPTSTAQPTKKEATRSLRIAIVELIRDLLIFIAVMFAPCIGLLVVVSKMPDYNPLKRILNALSHRVGATLAAGMIAIPVESIPGLDAFYDIAVPIALMWYWFTFFRDALRPSGGEKRSLVGRIDLASNR